MSTTTKISDRIYFHDVETLINCFTVTFVPTSDHLLPTVEPIQFVIHDLYPLGQVISLCNFLEEAKGLIGFNSLAFDSPVLKFIKDNDVRFCHGKLTTQEIATEIYNFSQEVIATEGWKEGLSNIAQRDLYRIHHFDNDAKRTSLKWVECHLGMSSIEDMPYRHDHIVTTQEEIDNILKYNLNDCIATKRLWEHKRTKELYKIRTWAFNETGNESYFNMSNASIGEKIFQKKLESVGLIGEPIKVDEVYVNRLILPYIKFRTPEFKKVYDWFALMCIPIDDEKKKINLLMKYDGMEYQFGLGGLHAARENEIFENIHSVDVESYYPNLSIVNSIAPRHVDELTFVNQYRTIFEQRKKTLKGTGENLGLKEMLNCVFGKSNSKYSFLYDPYFTFTITINGQLLLAMLCEELTESGAARVIMANTDGVEIQLLDKDKANKVVKWWKTVTRLNLEHARYDKIMIRDVNNYLAVKPDGDYKSKGAYESEKEFHKDPSMAVVPNMVKRVFMGFTREDNIIKDLKTLMPLEEFYMYARAKTGSFISRDKRGEEKDLPRTLRYLITKGGYLLARKGKKRIDKIHKNVYVTLLNTIPEIDPTPEELRDMIDYKWYADEVKKLLVKSKPATLF